MEQGFHPKCCNECSKLMIYTFETNTEDERPFMYVCTVRDLSEMGYNSTCKFRRDISDDLRL